MKTNLLLFTLALLLATACKKSDSNGPDNNQPNCALTKMTYALGSLPGTNLFIRDDAGKLIRVMVPAESNDTSSIIYVYSGNLLQYSFSSPPTPFNDTTFYLYDGQQRLERVIHHSWTYSSTLGDTTEYYRNETGQVICTLRHGAIDGSSIVPDSMVYIYTGNNVTRYTQYLLFEGNPEHHATDLEYDNMKNFYKTTGLPEENFLSWSQNNITRMTYAESGQVYSQIIFSGYNESGYPISAKSVSVSTGDTTNMQMEYLCK